MAVHVYPHVQNYNVCSMYIHVDIANSASLILIVDLNNVTIYIYWLQFDFFEELPEDHFHKYVIKESYSKNDIEV